MAIPITRVDLTAPMFHHPHEPAWVPLAPGHAIAADLATTPALRAAALGPLLPGPAALADESAVWVYTGRWIMSPLVRGLPRCAPLPGRSTRWTSDRRLLREDDIVILGDYPVTTMTRTAADLLACRPRDTALVGVVALMRLGVTHREISARLGDHFRTQPTGVMREISRQLQMLPQSRP
ncbi:MAG: hypothetical protein Q4P33_02220 [Flaviflexus sp.]|nr:hypothetical protein [Flaviflexus sp.]